MNVGELKQILKEHEDYEDVHIEGSGVVEKVTNIFDGGFKQKDIVAICLWS
jgi:hypothetical protein